MRIPVISRHPIGLLLCLAVISGGLPSLPIVPSAEAATSAQKRKFRKCRQKNRRLNKEVRMLRMKLAEALRPPPAGAVTIPGMVMIPGGPFSMGDSDNNTTGGDADELPVHTVNVSTFYIEKFEVTKMLWDEVADWAANNGYTDLAAGGGQGSFHPVHSVTWHDAVKWCNARSEMEGLTPVYYTDASQSTVYRAGDIDLAANFVNWAANGFRLPTDAEWEKAARGGAAGQTYPWGNMIGGGDANYASSGDTFEGTAIQTSPVGFYDGGQRPSGPNRANGFGLYDVSGNVWEWCWDWLDENYYSQPSATAPDTRGPASPSSRGIRVLRGGGWNFIVESQRVSNRYGNPLSPMAWLTNIGFRCARSQE